MSPAATMVTTRNCEGEALGPNSVGLGLPVAAVWGVEDSVGESVAAEPGKPGGEAVTPRIEVSGDGLPSWLDGLGDGAVPEQAATRTKTMPARPIRTLLRRE